MSSDNGQIKVDLNRITRPQFREYRRKIAAAQEDAEERERLMAEFYARVITEWPFGDAITADAYLGLGLVDSTAVDRAVVAAVNQLSEKK